MAKRKDPTKVSVFHQETAGALVNLAIKARTHEEGEGYLVKAAEFYQPAIDNKIDLLTRQLELLKRYATNTYSPEKPAEA